MLHRLWGLLHWHGLRGTVLMLLLRDPLVVLSGTTGVGVLAVVLLVRLLLGRLIRLLLRRLVRLLLRLLVRLLLGSLVCLLHGLVAIAALV